MSATTAGPVRVLAVEDERLVARDLKERLVQLGYEVPALASSAGEAIELVGKLQPSVVLMDIRLQGEPDGIDAAKMVRERFGIPVIFVTAHADPETLARARVAEPFGYILKPFDDRELKAAIEIAVYKRTAERRLLQTYKRLVRAHRIAQLGDWERDLATGTFRVSQEACRILGIVGGEGDHVSADLWFATVHPEDRAMAWRAFETAGTAGRDLQIEHRLSLRGDAERYVRQHGELVTGEGGQGLRLSGVVQDITEYKQLEERFRHAQKLEAVARLAGGIAHDFNNLLILVKAYSDMALADLTPQNPLYDPLMEIFHAGERASSLTRDLLAFSGKRVMRSQRLGLNDILRSLQELLRRLLPEDIEIREELAHDLMPVNVDANQIEQVVMNLVINAMDAMSKGGILVISTSNTDMGMEQVAGLGSINAGKYVVLSISDTGVGMSPDTQKRIFEPFFSTKPVGQGSGLGLSTVYGIVKQHGGALTVSSEFGRGSAFRVYIPASADAIDGTNLDLQQASRAYGGRETILVAEDDASVRKLAVAILKSLGYMVLEAASGEAAIELSNTHVGPIDLLLTDVVMAGVGGPELARKIASDRPSLKVLFMSGYPDSTIAERGLGEKGRPPLQKPFVRAELGRTIREALDGPSAARAIRVGSE